MLNNKKTSTRLVLTVSLLTTLIKSTKSNQKARKGKKKTATIIAPAAVIVKKKEPITDVQGYFLVDAIERRIKKYRSARFLVEYLSPLKVHQLFKLINNFSYFQGFKSYRASLLAYAVMYKLFLNKFSTLVKVSKFVGRSHHRKRKRRKRWFKAMKTKVPYYYLNTSRRSSLPKTYTKLKLYKLFWQNNDVFQTSTLHFIKRYAVFGKRAKMLKNILRRIIKKSKKKKNLKKYRYSTFSKPYLFKKNLNLNSLSGMFMGIKGDLTKVRRRWKRRRRKVVRKVTFKKFFFKTLIEGRSLVKLVLRKKFKRKSGFSNMVSASAHTTFFKRLHKLEFSLFNLVLRSRFTTSLKDTFRWIGSGAIFVNNTPTTNPYASLELGDRVQLAFSNRYFIYKKAHFSKNKKDIAKLRAKLWLKNRGKFNLFRKRSKHWPKWILRTTYYRSVVPSFLEVDYLTLTSVIVCLPKTIMEYDSILWRYLNVYNFRLYNWKITN